MQLSKKFDFIALLGCLPANERHYLFPIAAAFPKTGGRLTLTVVEDAYPEGAMRITILEQWKSERNAPKPIFGVKRKQVIEVECIHCHQRFLRWSSTASAYGRCENCATEH